MYARKQCGHYWALGSLLLGYSIIYQISGTLSYANNKSDFQHSKLYMQIIILQSLGLLFGGKSCTSAAFYKHHFQAIKSARTIPLTSTRRTSTPGRKQPLLPVMQPGVRVRK